MNPPSFNEKCSKFFKVFKSSEEAQDMIKSNCSPSYLSKLFFLPINSEDFFSVLLLIKIFLLEFIVSNIDVAAPP